MTHSSVGLMWWFGWRVELTGRPACRRKGSASDGVQWLTLAKGALRDHQTWSVRFSGGVPQYLGPCLMRNRYPIDKIGREKRGG